MYNYKSLVIISSPSPVQSSIENLLYSTIHVHVHVFYYQIHELLIPTKAAKYSVSVSCPPLALITSETAAKTAHIW